MDSLNIQSEVLRIIAVIFVLVSALEKEEAGRRSAGSLILTSLIIPGTGIIHWIGSGTSGLLYSLSGCATAGLISLALSMGRSISARETAAAMALGSIFGPAGAIFIFLIVYVLDIAQKALRADTSRVSDLMAGIILHGIAPAADEGGSRLVSTETEGIVKKEAEGPKAGRDRCGDEACTEEEKAFGDALPVMPWRIKIALASLSVLFSGIFI